MAKKDSVKAPKKDGQVQQEKPNGGKKKQVVNEIDEIFAGKKRKVQSQGKSDGGSQKGSSVKKRKPVNEIDLIFAGKKRKNQSQEKVDGMNQNESKKAKLSDKKGKNKKRSVEEEERRFADTPGKSRRKTADGLTIYTEEELGISKSEGGGGTSLCPFDCDCCF